MCVCMHVCMFVYPRSAKQLHSQVNRTVKVWLKLKCAQLADENAESGKRWVEKCEKKRWYSRQQTSVTTIVEATAQYTDNRRRRRRCWERERARTCMRIAINALQTAAHYTSRRLFDLVSFSFLELISFEFLTSNTTNINVCVYCAYLSVCLFVYRTIVHQVVLWHLNHR